jgi:hypothetical protein
MFEEIAIIAVSSIAVISSLLCINLLKTEDEINVEY